MSTKPRYFTTAMRHFVVTLYAFLMIHSIVAENEKNEDLELVLTKGSFLELQTTVAPQNVTTMMVFIKPSSCEIQPILMQSWQYTYYELPPTLRQLMPQAASALEKAVNKTDVSDVIKTAVNVMKATFLRGGGISNNNEEEVQKHQRFYDNQKNKKQSLHEAVEEVTRRDEGGFESKVKKASLKEYNDKGVQSHFHTDPKLAGRGILIDDDENFTVFTRNYFGIWRGLKLGKCEPNKYRHIALVQRGNILSGYIDGQQKNQITIAGTQDGNYLGEYTVGHFIPYPAHQVTLNNSTLDDIAIFQSSLSSDKMSQITSNPNNKYESIFDNVIGLNFNDIDDALVEKINGIVPGGSTGPLAASGPSGPLGASGPSGLSGASGPSGLSGASGPLAASAFAVDHWVSNFQNSTGNLIYSKKGNKAIFYGSEKIKLQKSTATSRFSKMIFFKMFLFFSHFFCFFHNFFHRKVCTLRFFYVRYFSQHLRSKYG